VTDDFIFRHPLVRPAIVQPLTPDERRTAHLALADLHRADVERRAVHLSAESPLSLPG
jgi:hypothetical protein